MGLLYTSYPIYILSKNRPRGGTYKIFEKQNIAYNIVIEPQDYDLYKHIIKNGNIILLDKNDQGPRYVRNFILQHSYKNGYNACWQFDDNLTQFYRKNNGKRFITSAYEAISELESIYNSYNNIGIIGFNYSNFIRDAVPRFYYNTFVYSAFLISNNKGIQFQGEFNLDNDICLQFLLKEISTVRCNYYSVNKVGTGVMKGGNYERYKKFGRLKMALEIYNRYPRFSKIKEEKKRYQIVVNWKLFRGVPLNINQS